MHAEDTSAERIALFDTITTVAVYALLAAAMTGHVAVLIAVRYRMNAIKNQQAQPQGADLPLAQTAAADAS